MHTDEAFWKTFDELVAASRIVVDRAADSRHPRFPEYVYPLDYGYLDGTSGGDGAGIDVWIGSAENRVTGAFMTIDPYKRDAEVKILLGCTAEDVARIHAFYDAQPQQALYVSRTPGERRAS